jgi:uncharacterized coiled-coil DUF342 family protein
MNDLVALREEMRQGFAEMRAGFAHMEREFATLHQTLTVLRASYQDLDRRVSGLEARLGESGTAV